MKFYKKYMAMRCVYCQKNVGDQHGLCQGCLGKIEAYDGNGQLDKMESDDGKGGVLNVKIFAGMYYKGMAKNLIIGMKYKQWFWAIPVVSGMMSAQLRKEDMEGFEVVAMPMHYRRMWQRGFNQAALLAKEVSRSLSSPMNQRCLIRKKNAKIQQVLKKAERFENMKGAFGVQGRIPKKILLVDDVMTTGATIKEACCTLIKNGVEEIIILVGAKAG
ncbi:MAG: ComF family protein [Pseudomonadota bacterium]|nr:ComF family protein [Pseudomonadota bacterium]